MPSPHYVRRHAPAPPVEPVPSVWPTVLLYVAWALFAVAVAVLVALFAAAGAGALPGHQVEPGTSWVTPSTYGVPA